MTSYITKKKLGYLNPADTNNHNLVWGDDPIKTKIIEEITISNNSGGVLTFRLFHKRDDETAGVANTLAYDIDVSGNSQIRMECQWYINIQEQLVCRSSSANDITFTAWGRVEE